jgi:Flp pilus assembly protein TadG
MMTRTLTRFAKRDDGQAVVEFALIMPFLLLFLVGIIEFGRAWNQHQVLTDATREGARKAAVFDPGITDTDIRNSIKSVLASNHMDPDSATITDPGWDGKTGEDVTVTVTYPYRFVFFGAVANWALGSRKILLTSKFIMRNE